MASSFDELDMKIAIAIGLGMSVTETADVLDISRQTLYNRVTAQNALHDTWRYTVEGLAEKTLTIRIGAAKSAQTAEQKITSRLDNALKVTDKILAQLTSEDESGTCTECGRITPNAMSELLAAQKSITTWISSYAASQAPKRVSLEGSMTHRHVVMSDDTVSGLLALAGHMRLIPALAALPEYTPPEADEAQIVTEEPVQ